MSNLGKFWDKEIMDAKKYSYKEETKDYIEEWTQYEKDVIEWMISKNLYRITGSPIAIFSSYLNTVSNYNSEPEIIKDIFYKVFYSNLQKVSNKGPKEPKNVGSFIQKLRYAFRSFWRELK